MEGDDLRALDREDLGLTRTQRRNIRLVARRPWITPAVLVFVWLGYFAVSWLALGILADHGAVVGIDSRADVWDLAMSWSDERREFHRYEVIVLDKVSTVLWQGVLIVLLTILSLAQQRSNQLTVKLLKALGSRDPAPPR